ncbi:MAG: sulfatase-like hydrolase/transferase [Acidobacteriota bacterium]
MKIRVLILFLLLITLPLSFCGSGGEASSEKEKTGKLKGKSFNVLLITIDTLRFDRIGVYSDKYVKTPNLDKFASESFVFTRGFAHNPVTLPSHTNILTGTTPLYHGISDNSGFVLEDRFLTITEVLKDNDYETGAFIGAFPLDSRFGLNQGFDIYDDNYGSHNNLELFFVERKAEDVLKPAKKWINSREGKWFSWIHLFDPHQPYLPPDPYKSEYPEDFYSGEVAYVDAELGKFFNFLRQSGEFEKTIIILTADHGEALGEKGEETHSYFAYNNTIHIPYIIYVPGTSGRKINRNVSHIDIFPSICDLTGIDIPDHIQGRSLLPLIRKDKIKEKYIYFESLSPYLNRGWAPLTGFIYGEDKFIDLPIREFYDLGVDLKENNNIITEKNGGNLKYKLDKLKKNLTSKDKPERSDSLDSETQKKLKSLGYFTGSSSKKKKVFSKKDDLKTLLPLQRLMYEALSSFQKGKAESAIKDLKSILDKTPGYILIYSHLAKIYRETGRIDLALDILDKGLKNNPGDPSLLSKLGIFLVEANRADKAIDILEQCIKIRSSDPENFNYLGVAYYKSRKFDKALLNYKKALELDDNYAPVLNNIGSMYLTLYQGNRDERAYSFAMDNFNKALKIDGKLHSAFNGRGAAKYFKGDYEGAISDWKNAIESKPDFIDPYFSVGITYMVKMKDKRKAYEYFTLCKKRVYKKLPQKEQQRLNRLIDQTGY